MNDGKIQLGTKLLVFALPIATLVTLVVLLFGGGMKQIGSLADLTAFALELAPRTLYAIAIAGSASVMMHATATDLGNGRRKALIQAAETGGRGPLLILAGETLAWMLWVVIFTPIYLHGLL
jgi:hypothetical protein